MPHYICVTCGTQYAESANPPEQCPICEDDRQYRGWKGQQWTTLEDMRPTYTNSFIGLESGLTGIKTQPDFAIGQRAYHIQTPHGNILWECVTHIDDATIAAIQSLGGISAIAISHPHFYSTIVEWSRALGNVPIYIHRDNQPFVMRPDSAIEFWDGETKAINPDLTLIRCGGHFPGSTVLHWNTQNGGALLTGDTIYVVQDRRYVSFMYSYPNLIPMSASKVTAIVNAVEPYNFSRIYSSFTDRVMAENGKAAVKASAERYIAHIRD